MKKIYIIILLSLLCFAVSAQSNEYREASAEETIRIIENLSLASEQMHTLTCDFEQINSISALEEEVKSSGIMEYRREGEYLVWEYLSPYQNKITISEGTITMGSGEGATIMDSRSGRMVREMTNIMLSSVNGTGLKESEAFSAQYGIYEESVRVTLTPKQKKMAKIFTSIELYIDTEDYTAYKIVLFFFGGDKTTMTIKNKKIN